MTHHRSRILIVEDEEVLGENLRDFLLRRKAEVYLAPTAEAALDEVSRFRPDCVVLDYSLPGIDGLDAFVRLRADFPGLRGVLISGHPTEQLRALADQAGVEHLLTKPFSFAEFERVLLGWQSGGTVGPGGDARDSEDPRWAVHRSNRPAADLPLSPPGGGILQDRRRGERRGLGPGSLAEWSARLAPF